MDFIGQATQDQGTQVHRHNTTDSTERANRNVAIGTYSVGT